MSAYEVEELKLQTEIQQDMIERLIEAKAEIKARLEETVRKIDELSERIEELELKLSDQIQANQALRNLQVRTPLPVPITD